MKPGWSDNTIAGIALAAGLALFVSFMTMMFAFCSAMMARAKIWTQVGLEISPRERLAFVVANFWQRYWPVLSPILLLVFVGVGLTAALIVVSSRRRARAS